MASNDDTRDRTLKPVANISKDIYRIDSNLVQSSEIESVDPSTCTAKLDGNSEDAAYFSNPAANPECNEEDYFSLWHQNHHGSVDLGLDEKLTSMTGSYSEILDDSRQEVSESDNARNNASAYRNNTQDLCTKLEDKRKGEVYNVKESTGGAMPKSIKPPENTPASLLQWNENTRDESLSSLVREFSEKSNISSQPSKRKECLLRNMSSSQNVPRSLLYPSVPPVDPTVIADLEDQARNIATSMDTLIENLTGTLHSISSLSVDCVETYRDAVCKTCDAVDSNIKSMYQLMAKCEELSKSMKPMYKLHDQIKEIRRLLDLFESAVYSGGT